jgi:hypothetical protein
LTGAEQQHVRVRHEVLVPPSVMWMTTRALTRLDPAGRNEAALVCWLVGGTPRAAENLTVRHQ